MKFTYYVSDGYAGAERAPHHFTIPDEEIAQADSTEDLQGMIEDSMQEHFEQNVAPNLKNGEIEKAESYHLAHKDDESEDD